MEDITPSTKSRRGKQTKRRDLPMAEKVSKAGVKKEKGYLYFIDKKGNVARAKMARGGRKKGKQKTEVVAKTGVSKAKGYLYFLDGSGDVARAKMSRGGRKKKRK